MAREAFALDKYDFESEAGKPDCKRSARRTRTRDNNPIYDSGAHYLNEAIVSLYTFIDFFDKVNEMTGQSH
jgi:hypothetical protein